MNKFKTYLDNADVSRFRFWVQIFTFVLFVYGGVAILFSVFWWFSPEKMAEDPHDNDYEQISSGTYDAVTGKISK